MAAERFSLLLESRATGQQDIERLTTAVQKLMATTEQASGRSTSAIKKQSDDLRAALDSVKGAITNPFEAATQGAENFALKFGRVGVIAGGAAAGLAVTVSIRQVNPRFWTVFITVRVLSCRRSRSSSMHTMTAEYRQN